MYSKLSYFGSGPLGVLMTGASDLAVIDLVSFNNGGATFSNTRNGDPTGTATVNCLFFR